MKKIYTHPEFGTLTAINRKGNDYYRFEDLQRGMTLIDEEDTINRIGESSFVKMICGYHRTELYLKSNALREFTQLTSNPKANRFKGWLWKEVVRDFERLNKTSIYDKLPKKNDDPVEEEDDMADSNVSLPAPTQTSMFERTTPADSIMREFTSEKFGMLRAVVIDDEPLFVGKDVATILGYNNTRDALAKHVDEREKFDGVAIRDSIGREQNPVLINESGVYSLIFSSKLPAAKEFKYWVTSEVLPSIRKRGGYLMNQERMTSEQLFAQAVLYANNVVNSLKAENETLHTYIEANAEHTTLGRMVDSDGRNMSIGAFAKLIFGDESDLGRNKMFKKLSQMGYLMRSTSKHFKGYWEPKQKYLNLGYFEMTLVKPSTGYGLVPVVLITPKGQLAISKKLAA